MSTRLAWILTGIWTLIVVLGCGGGIWYVAANAPRAQQKQRMQMLGSGMGTVAGIGYGAIWLPWAARVGRKRREQRAAEARRKEREEEDRPRRKKRRPVEEDD